MNFDRHGTKLLRVESCVRFYRGTTRLGAGKKGERVRVREAISYVGRHLTELSVVDLAESLGVDPTCVSRSVGRVERRLATDRGIKKMVADISAAVENGKYQA